MREDDEEAGADGADTWVASTETTSVYSGGEVGDKNL